MDTPQAAHSNITKADITACALTVLGALALSFLVLSALDCF
jgi:hypothetical protein